MSEQAMYLRSATREDLVAEVVKLQAEQIATLKSRLNEDPHLAVSLLQDKLAARDEQLHIARGNVERLEAVQREMVVIVERYYEASKSHFNDTDYDRDYVLAEADADMHLMMWERRQPPAEPPTHQTVIRDCPDCGKPSIACECEPAKQEGEQGEVG